MKLLDILLQPEATVTPEVTPTATPNNVINSIVSGTDWGGLFFLIVLVILLIWIARFAWRTRDADLGAIKLPNIDTRTSLALGVVIISIIGVIVLAVVGILNAEDKTTATTQIMSAILPLLGTWVGTVMAFYFGRENYESAAKNTERATVAGGSIATGRNLDEILSSTKVTDKMLPRSGMFYLTLQAGNRDDALKALTLDKMLADLDAAGAAKGTKWYRIPILDDKLHPIFVVHRSIIDEFINQETAPAPGPAKDRTKLTLYDLHEDGYFKAVLDQSVEVLAENTTLADAKLAMGKYKNCQDVFITHTGSRDEEVLGWITNNIIQDAGKV